MDITLKNYPPDSRDTAIRTLVLGGASTTVTVLVEVALDEDDEPSLVITLDAGASHSEINDTLTELIELLQAVVDADGVEVDEEEED